MTSQITLVGNATKPAELRYTPSGQATASFGLAVNKRWKNKQTEEWEEKTSFFDVVCWGTLAENVAESSDKGTRLVVVGRLEQRSWENEAGERRSKIEVVADEVAPSLRFSTAQVVKNERQGAQGSNSQGAQASSNYSGYDSGEEPF